MKRKGCDCSFNRCVINLMQFNNSGLQIYTMNQYFCGPMFSKSVEKLEPEIVRQPTKMILDIKKEVDELGYLKTAAP